MYIIVLRCIHIVARESRTSNDTVSAYMLHFVHSQQPLHTYPPGCLHAFKWGSSNIIDSVFSKVKPSAPPTSLTTHFSFIHFFNHYFITHYSRLEQSRIRRGPGAQGCYSNATVVVSISTRGNEIFI